MMFFFSRSGHIYKKMEPISFWLISYRRWDHWFWDILWMLSVFKIMKDEGLEIIAKIRHDGFYDGLCDYVGFGNLVDWTNVFYALSILVLWLWHCDSLSELREIMSEADPTKPGSWDTDAERDEYFDKVVSIV